MKLLAVKLLNFRSYQNEVNIPLSDFTALIGRNDIGKSTILEALEIFFNNEVVKIDGSDPCVHAKGKIVEIACVFDELPTALVLDERSETSLEAEYLLNSEGKLEIVKQFNCAAKTIKCEIFARAQHPIQASLANLLQLKNADLKTRLKELTVGTEGVDQRSNTSLRSAIRANQFDGRLEERLIPLAADDAKKVWEQLQGHLPAFALFQADRPSRDDDPEVADPMKVAVAAAVKEVEPELEAIKAKVQARALEVASRTLDKLREMDSALASELNPSFKAEPKWDGFKLSLTGENDIPINKRGSGVRRLILLNFFRAEAERRRQDANSKDIIFAIEEPESSQHPDNQVMLIKALLSLSTSPNTQVLITTHVPAVAAMVPTEAIRLVKRNEANHPEVMCGGDNVYHEVAECLGVLPDKRAKVAIYVEGPHDVTFLTHISRLYRDHDNSLIDLEHDHRVAFVPTGGGNLKHWVNKRYLENMQLTEVHIYDTDDAANPKYKPQVDAVNARGTADIAFLTQKREMENYLHPESIAASFGFVACPEFTDWCDVPELVAERVHVESGSSNPWVGLLPEKRSSKASKAKARLNQDAAAAMTLAQLQAVDASNEILGWLMAIRDRTA